MKIDIKNFQKWPLTTKILVISLLCVIIFYFTYTWDVSALKSSLSNEEQKEKDIKQQFSLILDKQMIVLNQTQEYEKLESLVIESKKKLPSYADITEVINEVLKLGAANHIYFALFTPLEEKPEKDYIKVPLKVVAVGSYHQLADFISQVANMSWIVVIGDFIISIENKNDVIGPKLAALANSQNLLSAELILEIYRLPRDAELPKKTDAASTPTSAPESKNP